MGKIIKYSLSLTNFILIIYNRGVMRFADVMYLGIWKE